MKIRVNILIILFVFLISSCRNKENINKPNVILIMVDDMGYECVGAYGSTSYKTPNIDQIASQGILFSNCISQPLCTPSRVKIMTGKYNYKNYDYFGHLNLSEYSFGNLMQDAGYETCIAGKWQLNGLAYKDKIDDWNDNSRPNKFGFDEYCLWQLTKERSKGGRYGDPLIEQNGEVLDKDINDYGPDIFANYILDFIERKQDESFFVYYPMVLVHDPFVPTPDSDKWDDQEVRYKNDTTYFKDMVSYTDKIVGKITNKLKALDLDKNTILIFTADNGTHPSIYSQLADETIQGAKGNTINAGVHVPLIVYWPSQIKNGHIFNGLIAFSDFFPTLADIVKTEVNSDGRSFYPLLTGGKYDPRETVFVHYDPQWGNKVSQYRNQFVRTMEYKLYQDGNFFELKNDKLEENPLQPDSLETEKLNIRTALENEIKKHPEWK
ncbi:MAG: sulfatase-like hydrolase/transferase [Bacteroidota bacterium]